MNFLNPFVLFGLIAASIPLILHLLNLRKLKLVEFSSLKFIKEMQKTKIRRLKLKQILLLILRTLIVVFIVLAFARPTVSTNLPLIGTYANSDIVIIIDNSFSMDVSDEFGNRFTQAKNIANDVMKNMIDGDNAVIIPMSHSGVFAFELSSSLTSLKQDLSKLPISNRPANIDNSVRYSYSLLEKSINMRKEIFIISDAQTNTFARKYRDSRKYYYPNTNIYFIPVGLNSGTAIRNISIDSLAFVTRIIQSDKPVEIRAHINNHSASDITGLVASLYFNNNRVAQRPVDIPSGQSKEIILGAPVGSTGLIKGYVEIENDDLDYDNKRYFNFATPDKPRVVLFGNQSSVLPLSFILSNSSLTGSEFASYNSSQIPSIDFSNYDIVIYADGPYKNQDFSKANDFVRHGGSLLLFADNSNTEQILYAGLVTLGFSGASRQNLMGKTINFDYTDKQHPIFEGVFKGTTDNKKIVESPQIARLFPPLGGQKIISTAAGTFLAESRPGKGKVFYFGVNLSNDWSNFTRTGIFPVLMYRSIIYLGSKEALGQDFIINEPVRYQLPSNFSSDESFKIVDPNNLESYSRSINPGSQPLLEINSDVPGNYAVYSSLNKLAGSFSLNREPSESELNRTNKKNIVNSMSTLIAHQNDVTIIEPNNLMKDISRARTGSELWQFLIIMAIITAIAEMFVARSLKNEN